MMKQFCFLFLFALASLIAHAQPSHEAFDALLKKNVSAAGKVNYKNFKNDKAALDAYIKNLTDNTPKKHWSKNAVLAYWINAYNALTINLIIQNYPLSKITDLDGGKTWDVKRYAFDGKKMSLNDIENNVLRPMGDARIHFAINCAAKSCPPLYNAAFTAENLDDALTSRTQSFINSSANSLKTNEVKISKIFEWYAKDFDNLITFLNKYGKVKINKTAKVTYQDYDWRLNE